MRQNPTERTAAPFVLPAPKAGVAFSISPQGARPFLAAIFDRLDGKSVPLADIDLPDLKAFIPGSGGGATFLNQVTVAGGSANKFTLDLNDVRQDATVRGRFNVTASAGFDACYERWLESGVSSSPATPHSPPIRTPFKKDAGRFSFKATSLAMQFAVDFSVETNGDPFDLSQKWSIVVVNVEQTGLTLRDVKVPKDSVLNSSFLRCIGEHADRQAKKALSGENLAKTFADAANARLATLPDSGALTENITFCFPPQQVAYPDSGGMQASVSGLILYKSTRYTELLPQELELLPIPVNNDISFVISPYEIDALLWALNQNGDFSVTLDAQNSDEPALFNTASYRSTLPEFFQFAPDEQFSIAANEAAFIQGQPPSGPRTRIECRWVLSEAILGSLKVPADVVAKLKEAIGIVYPTVEALMELLKEQLLTPEEFAAWGAKLTAAAATQSLVFNTGLDVDIKLLRQGVETTLLSSHLQLEFIGARFDVTVNSGIQTLNFDFETADHLVDRFEPIKGLAIPAADISLWYRFLLSLPIDAFIAFFRPPGHLRSAVPVPHIAGFNFKDVDVRVTSEGMIFDGNFT